MLESWPSIQSCSVTNDKSQRPFIYSRAALDPHDSQVPVKHVDVGTTKDCVGVVWGGGR